MTYQEFKETIIHTIQLKLGNNAKVTIQDIIKNNDTHLDGLTILTNQSNLSPTIYLNPYYEQYQNGKSLSEIYAEILSVYARHKPTNNIDISFYTDYSKVKDHIIYKLVNYERNKDLLKEVPHIRHLDLAIVFNCLMELDQQGAATILIRNDHLSLWDKNADDLYALAKTNTPLLLSHQFFNISEIIRDYLNEEEFHLYSNDLAMIPMYILTNSKRLQGSACILYENLLSDIANQLNSDLYILPSSVHEVILIPAESANAHAELTSMVKDVNATQLAREDILSDHVYYYSRETNKLSM